ncbi:MAG: M55 family metallopeptidase [Spirochaetes bacterium]|nr:M55 family metallopeptidase [Spirochaetota bacterium]
MLKVKKTQYRHILIIADIEGSSGCRSYEASKFLTEEWTTACKMMSLDIAAVVKALFEAEVEHVTVKDFHRTGFNILPELIDSRARLVSGYIKGPVPGIGDPGGADAVMFIGLHAASGTDGFLAHTLTSRIERLEMNGRVITELELFASSLAPYGLTPIFFSGCSAACAQARSIVKNITTYAIDKTKGQENFDVHSWRAALAEKATRSLANRSCRFTVPEGPFSAVVTMRDGERIARKLSKRWGMRSSGRDILFEADDIHTLYMQLIRICYLTPLVERFSGISLFLNNLYGRIGRLYVRWKTAD